MQKAERGMHMTHGILHPYHREVFHDSAILVVCAW